MWGTLLLAAVSTAAPATSPQDDCSQFDAWLKTLEREAPVVEGASVVQTDLPSTPPPVLPYLQVTAKWIHFADVTVNIEKSEFDETELREAIGRERKVFDTVYAVAHQKKPSSVVGVVISPETPMSVVLSVAKMLVSAKLTPATFVLGGKGTLTAPAPLPEDVSANGSGVAKVFEKCEPVKKAGEALTQVESAEELGIAATAFRKNKDTCACSADLAVARSLFWALAGRDRFPAPVHFALQLSKTGDVVQVDPAATWADGWKLLQAKAAAKKAVQLQAKAGPQGPK